MNERLNKYITSLTEEERLVYCRKQISNVLSNYRSKEKALKAEFNFNGDRKGIRGGRKTTLSASATVKTQIYFSSIEDLKAIIKYL